MSTATMTDVELQRDVLDQLKWEPSVDPAHIGVSVKNGVVTLSGHVSSFAQKYAAERAANRRFHFGLLDTPDQPHALRVIRLLWDSTEAYRALYYNLEDERRSAVSAHDRILDALRDRDSKRLVGELAAHRERALVVLREVLASD